MPSSSFIRKNQHILRNRPLVVGTLTGALPVPRQLAQTKTPFVDIIEVRLDTFKAASYSLSFSKNLISLINKKSSKPLLLTFRSASEAGRKKKGAGVPDSFRAHVLKHLLSHVDLVDLEIRRSEFVRKVMPACRQKKVAVIHSFHDFSGPGNWTKISTLSQKSKRIGGDFFKVAVTLKNQQSLNKFLASSLNLSHPSKVLIGMGAHGQMTRTLGFTFGSLLTYGHLGKSAAPGQVRASQLGKQIRAIYKSNGK